MTTLKIAIQKSGRLSEKSLQLLKDCGIKIANSDRKLKTEKFATQAIGICAVVMLTLLILSFIL